MIIKDKQSSEWLAVKEWAETRLAELREENDGELDLVTTSNVRGKIGLIKELLDLDKPNQKIEIQTTDYID